MFLSLSLSVFFYGQVFYKSLRCNILFSLHFFLFLFLFSLLFLLLFLLFLSLFFFFLVFCSSALVNVVTATVITFFLFSIVASFLHFLFFFSCPFYLISPFLSYFLLLPSSIFICASFFFFQLCISPLQVFFVLLLLFLYFVTHSLKLFSTAFCLHAQKRGSQVTEHPRLSKQDKCP